MDDPKADIRACKNCPEFRFWQRDKEGDSYMCNKLITGRYANYVIATNIHADIYKQKWMSRYIKVPYDCDFMLEQRMFECEI